MKHDSVGECPACGRAVAATQPLTHCLGCGKDLPADVVARLNAPVTVGEAKRGIEPGVSSVASANAPARVVVVDFDMPMGSMVSFMIKWAFASIPAFLVLLVFAGVVSMFLGGAASACTTGLRGLR